MAPLRLHLFESIARFYALWLLYKQMGVLTASVGHTEHAGVSVLVKVCVYAL